MLIEWVKGAINIEGTPSRQRHARVGITSQQLSIRKAKRRERNRVAKLSRRRNR